MKLIKTRLRTRLEEETLSDLMTISLLGPDVYNFDFSRPIGWWKREKKRYFY